MDAINLAAARARLSELDIIRRGKSEARLTAVTKPCRHVDATLLRSLTASMPSQIESGAELARSMRDSDRY
jgi:hypothetical protein